MATKKKETKTLRDVALGFAEADVTAMIADITDSLTRRHSFESAGGTVLTGGSSWDKAVQQVNKSQVAVARLFLALGITPSSVFERRVVENKMFNAKAIKKIVEIANYVSGIGQRMERVTRAFVACALIASDKEPGVPVTNALNQKFLGSKDLGAYIKDPDILDNIDALRHKSMSTGAETQSSQARNVLDVLGLGVITGVDRARDAIKVHLDAPFYAMFRKDFMV